MPRVQQTFELYEYINQPGCWKLVVRLASRQSKKNNANSFKNHHPVTNDPRSLYRYKSPQASPKTTRIINRALFIPPWQPLPSPEEAFLWPGCQLCPTFRWQAPGKMLASKSEELPLNFAFLIPKRTLDEMLCGFWPRKKFIFRKNVLGPLTCIR